MKKAKLKCIVTAHALNRKTKKVISESRDEEIFTDNELFADASTAEEVKGMYEAFWNDLNPRSEDIVKVLAVKVLF